MLTKTWDIFTWIADRLNMEAKVLCITVGFILFLGVGVTFEMRTIVSNLMQDELEKQGMSIASDLSARSADLLLTSNIFALHQLLRNTLQNNSNVEYAFVLDNQGQVVAHTFRNGFPIDLLGIHDDAVRRKELPGKALVRIEDQIIHDFSSRISTGNIGTARVGLHERNIQASIRKVVIAITQTTLLMSVVGIFAASILTSLLHQPINLLVEATRRMSRGNYRQRVEVQTKDQIGTLAQAFNELGVTLHNKEQENDTLWAELKKKEEVLRTLLKTVITAQETERKRISRELHDETGQVLSSLMLHLQSMKDRPITGEMQEEMENIRSLIARTIHEVKRISRQLRPSILDDMGLFSALNHLCEEYQSNGSFDVDMVVYGQNTGKRLLAELEIALYRIVQESLTNISKHAQARNVSIIFTLTPDQLYLVIEDDGKGFDVEQHFSSDAYKEHLGLHGMQERVEIIGGTLQIESSRETGTTIYVNVPLQFATEEKPDDKNTDR
ncbi:histidine kinase [Desulfurispirillum indicum]|uniref:HAMP domain-containing sensor histidine kinase n=1 Tax=Desulfurispirillum indicum TaxID=936456 RepID=UPI001CFB6CEA|nr:ATP-binding protein [Desulfurispirillum indicum]UCZ57035.1 histidine kinase [Desulfurispirillum indicum]